MNIILMGYRCTGKSSAGRLLAERTGRLFYDTDALVERKVQRTIPQIVAEQGWLAFREMESEVIRGLSGAERSVIALGGGAILDPRNIDCLKRDGLFVWLFAASETVAARMEKDAAGGAERPPLTDDKDSISEMKAVMAQREPLYRRFADLVVDTTGIELNRVVELIQGGLWERLPEAERTIGAPEKNR